MDVRLRIFRTLLARWCPGRLVDLGCGHGKFALVAKDLGWQVTAVDARRARMPMTPGIDWIEADIRTFPVDGYDCVCVLGLLYHLELADILDLLKRCAGTPTIIDTHVALVADHEELGYAGRTFREIEGDTLEALTATVTASWRNPTSFWPTKESLIRILHESGFDDVFELTPSYLPDRNFYVCLS